MGQPSSGHAFYAVSSARCRAIHEELAHFVAVIEPACSLTTAMQNCIDLYMEWIFPLSPLACEAHLRAGVNTIVHASQDAPQPLDPRLSELGEEFSVSGEFGLPEMRVFSLLAALCSITCCVVPASVWPCW